MKRFVQLKPFQKIYILFEVCAILVTLGISLYCIFAAKPISMRLRNTQATDWSEDWMYNGQELISLPYKYKVEKGSLIRLSKQLPERIHEGEALCFFSYYAISKVYVEEELIYTYGEKKDIPFGNIRGTVYCVVSLLPEYAGKTVTITYEPMYSKSATLHKVYYGTRNAMITNVFSIDGWRVPAIVALVFIAFFTLLFSLFKGKLNIQIDKYFLIQFGSMNLALAFWLFFDSNLYQLLFDIALAASVAKYISIINLGILYAANCRYVYPDEIVTFKRLETIGYVGLFVITLCHLLSIADPYELGHSVHLYLAINILLSFYVSVKKINKNDNAKIMCFNIGTLSFFCFLGLFVELKSPGEGLDAKFVTVGYIFFILGLLVLIEKMNINNSKKLVEDKVYKELAYIDSLTGINNRIAFEQCWLRITQEADSQTMVTFIMCDLNYLKQTNDQLGHEAGDQLIITTAKILDKSSKENGATAFRLGGDEFCIIYFGKEQIEQKIVHSVRNNIESFNQGKQQKVSMAIGAASAWYADKESFFRTLYQKADESMYEEKQRYHSLSH